METLNNQDNNLQTLILAGQFYLRGNRQKLMFQG